MSESYYRKATKEDVVDPNHGPSELRSRLLTAFLVLGCGIFSIVYFFSKSAVLAGSLSGALLSLSVYSIFSNHRAIKKRELRLAEPDPVEVIEFRPIRVFDVEAPGSTGPALCFELPDKQMLLLCGQWLWNHELYRAPRPVDDGNQERFNLADDPFGFPSNHFALHRWRGEVSPFWIEVLGEYLDPVQVAVSLPSTVRLRDVEIFAGTFDSLQADIDSAFKK